MGPAARSAGPARITSYNVCYTKLLRQVWGLLRGRLAQPASYYRASLEQKLQYGCYYLGLLAFLAIMSQHLHQQLAPLRG